MEHTANPNCPTCGGLCEAEPCLVCGAYGEHDKGCMVAEHKADCSCIYCWEAKRR